MQEDNALEKDPQILRYERTEEEKARRHLYGEVGARHSARKLTPRTDEMSNTITTVQKDNLLLVHMLDGSERHARIRKLTPTECFRLMGVSDENIHKIQKAGVSKSQQYKMAGNSIVVDVLYHLFRKMFVEPNNELGDYYQDIFQSYNITLPPLYYNKSNPLRVCTAFSGYDSQCMGLDMLKERYDFDYELVAWSEIDPYAIKAHNAVYPQYAERNLGDISKIDWKNTPSFDLFTYSFPCTDISSAGLQKGFSEGSGTRSGLLWECRKAIEEKRPRILLMENVAALVQKKFCGDFYSWQQYLSEQGYSNYWKILNSKDYGVPQNRDRVFMVSLLDKETTYNFPKPITLERRLKDVIEWNVDECFFVKEDRLEDAGVRTLEETSSGSYRVV